MLTPFTSSCESTSRTWMNMRPSRAHSPLPLVMAKRADMAVARMACAYFSAGGATYSPRTSASSIHTTPIFNTESATRAVAPPAEKYAQAMRATAMSARFAITSGNGLWARDGRKFNHVRDVISQEDVKGVSIYEFDDQRRLRQMTVAEAGHYTDDDWRLTGVARSRIDSARVTTEHLIAFSWRSLLNPDMIEVVAVKPDSLSITGLIGYIRYLADNGLSVDRYALALWSKLVLPITTMVMLFLSIPFIFGPLRSVGVGQRIFYGVLVGIGFYLIDKTFSFVGLAYAFPTAISATLPTILFLILAVIMMMRVR